MGEHANFYSQPELYALAFGFRDVTRECQFFSETYAYWHNKPLTCFLELGAGPAEHARAMARQGVAAAALDLSPDMVRYGRQQAMAAGLDLAFFEGNMVNFTLEFTFDLAVLLMDSASYLLCNAAVYRHLEAVAAHLTPGGLYILEMSHPRDTFKTGSSTQTEWEMERDGLTVLTQWGRSGDPFDPISQVTQVTATLTAFRGGQEVARIEEQAPQRGFSANEFKALVDACPHFEIVEIFGSLDRAVPFDNSQAAWRMVPVLQRV